MAKSSLEKNLFALARAKNAWAYVAMGLQAIALVLIVLDIFSDFRSGPWSSIVLFVAFVPWRIAVFTDNRRQVAADKAEAQQMLDNMKEVGNGKK